MKKIEFTIQSVPENVPVKITISVDQKRYSDVRLYITRQDGKPAVVKGKYWFVYFYFRNPITGLMEKIIDKCGINKYKTVAERKQWGRAWVEAYSLLLSQGYDPFDPDGIKPGEFTARYYTVRSGMLYAYQNMAGQLKEASREDYRVRMNVFLEWAAAKGIDNMGISDLAEVHLVAFLNWLTRPKPEGRGVGLTSQDNYKRGISALLGKLVRDKIIPRNPLEAMETKKGKPLKNTPFTGVQVRQISEYLRVNDPQLHRYIQFVVYALMRPREIVRLRAGDFNLADNYLSIETKTEGRAMVRLIGPIKEYLDEIAVHRIPAKAHIFTDTGDFEVWTKGEKAKTDHFGLRFRKVKDHFGLGEQYGIYSFRHTAALDLYHAFVRDGAGHIEAVRKLMPILRHTSEKTTEKYLREIGAQLPRDYGAFYTLEF